MIVSLLLQSDICDSFHSNFGGKLNLLLFLFFKYFKGFMKVA
jgi:hypothetical protein